MYTTFQTHFRFALLAAVGFIGLAWMFLALGWIIPEFICDGLAVACGIDAMISAVRKQQACPDPDERRR